MTSLRLGPYGQYLPMFSAIVLRGDDRLMLKVYSRAPGMPLRVRAQLIVNHRVAHEERFAVALNPSATVDLSLSWTSDGAVCAALAQGKNAEKRLLDLGGPPTGVKLFASTGEFRFDSVELMLRPAGDAAAQDATIKANCVPVS